MNKKKRNIIVILIIVIMMFLVLWISGIIPKQIERISAKRQGIDDFKEEHEKKDENYNLSDISFNGMKLGDKTTDEMLEGHLVMDAEFKFKYNDINLDIDNSNQICYLGFYTTWNSKGDIIRGIDDIKIKYKDHFLKTADDFKIYFGNGKISSDDKLNYTVDYEKDNIKLSIRIKDGNLINVKLENI